MKNLSHPTWIKFKGMLFLFVGGLAAILLVIEHPDWKTVMLLSLSIWCFCRFYYFAFYVVEHYVDAGYRFSGLWSFTGYLLRRRKFRAPPSDDRP